MREISRGGNGEALVSRGGDGGTSSIRRVGDGVRSLSFFLLFFFSLLFLPSIINWNARNADVTTYNRKE